MLLLVAHQAVAQHGSEGIITFTGIVTDAEDHTPLAGAIVTVTGKRSQSAVADARGRYSVNVAASGTKTYQLRVTYVGYRAVTKNVSASRLTNNIAMQPDAQLDEVVVTAKEGSGPITSSVIGRDAMQHLQPNSIADLMELLPGGYSKDPDMGSANTLSLRESGTMGAYGSSSRNNNFAISSLGTQFIVDGVPLSTDANMQYSPLSDTQSNTTTASTENSRNITNRGVDMRSIGTDDVESVEVVRGIPSAEYGNLTSGLVNIRKIRRAQPLTARFKADGYSKLFSIGKGFNLGQTGNRVLNIDFGWLDSKTDPTNNLENYKRLTASLRYTDKSEHERYHLQWNSAFDYTGSFDDAKQDPDINYGRVDEYKSSYSRMALTNTFSLKPKKSIFSELSLNTMLSLQLDRLRQTRLVAPQRYGIVPLSWSDGENEAYAVFNEYMASYLCDGKPFNAYVKAKAVMDFKAGATKHNLKLGLNWDINKNFGRGQVYDMHAPLSVSGWSSRPRKYSDIPALQNLSAFIEELMKVDVGASQLEVMAGVRFNSLPGLDSQYAMSGKIYADPRINLSWHAPKFDLGGSPMAITLNGGYGITTKMPTLNYLYPDKYYSNFICLAYYDTQNPTTDSKFIVHTYVQDPTNYNIKPARNRKLDLRLDLSWKDNTLSLNYFREKMSDGFRYSRIYGVYNYNYYDVSQMGAGIDYTTIPYEARQVLDGYSQSSNGSKLDKQGVELQFTSARIRPLRTRINITGAWFRTTYTNSQPMFESVSTVVNNKAVSDYYVGLYDWNDGRQNDRLNTNVTFDTQIPEWKLIFTTSVQCMWLIRTKTMWRNGTPTAYISAEDGQLHDFTAESAEDMYLKQLIKTYNDASFEPFTVPMSMTINFKATKEIGRYLRLSFFANKILDYMPDYTANGRVIRRNASPYFGVEASVKI